MRRQRSAAHSSTIASAAESTAGLLKLHLERQLGGDQPLVQQLEQQLALADSDDPFELYIQAVQAEQAGREALAISFYQRLQKRVPYLLQANQALVRHYLKNHQYQAARQLLEQALEYSYEPEKRSLLEHKLTMLRTM